MKFLPNINLWDNAIHSALVNGQLKLQPGQWVYCGNSKPSRFVGMRGNSTIWAVHPEDGKVSNKRFLNLLDIHKNR